MSEHLHYRIHDGRGPPLLLVHGVLSSSAQWRPNLAALGAVATPVTVDLWGHGDSPAPADPARYAPASYVAEFDRVRDALGAPRCYLCGYSLGAGLTMRYAFEHPERVLAHVFTNSASAFAELGANPGDPEHIVRRIESGGREAMERLPIHPRHARRLPAEVYQALIADAERLDPAGVARTLAYTGPRTSVRAELHRNTRPALLTCGVFEKRFLPHREFAERHMPHLTVAELAAGHAVNAQDAAAFNRAVADFCTRWRT